MFEPKTYQEKRNSMNEMLIQQLVNVVMRSSDPQSQAYLRDSMERFAVGHSRLRDAEALRILGPLETEVETDYADQAVILQYLQHNLGRTFFGQPDPTAAADGSIGTAGFGKKYKDWLAELPNFDESIGVDMKSGFYADYMTKGPADPMAVLVLHHGSELILIAYHKYLSTLTLHLDYVPEAYNWSASSHYALRGEMFTYRGNMKVEEFEVLLAQALSGHTALPLAKPVFAELPVAEELATVGYSQVIEEAPAANDSVISEEAPVTFAEVAEVPQSFEPGVAEHDSEASAAQLDEVSERGLTTAVTPIDEAGYVAVDTGGEAPPVVVVEETKEATL